MEMKKIISLLILSAIFVTTLLAILPVNAATSTLTTDKTTYVRGEPIKISAASDNASGKDWVGIAPKDLYVGTIRWDYLKDITGDYDITAASNQASNETLKPYMNFPEGEYTIYLIENDKTLKKAKEGGYILASVDIVIERDPNATLKAPLSASYDIADASSGLADGTLTVNLPENHYANDIYMWWANDEGILEDYTRLARFKVDSFDTLKITHKMTPNTLIPAEATKLLVYTYSDVFGLSEEYAEITLPQGAGYDFPTEAPITEFQVISDIHIGYSAAPYEEHFRAALEDIVANSPNSSGIFANGDLVDVGSKVSLWDELWAIYDSVEGAPAFFPGIGNHEYNGFSYNQGLKSFLTNIRMPEGYEKPDGVPYYDVWVNGYHYIFLGDSSAGGCDIGKEQYDWLEKKLADKVDDRPVFIFFHQPMKNTVAGSMESEGWWALSDDTRMRQILAEHPEAFFFNGHTHWILDSYNTMYGGKEQAAIFNTSSVAYLWHSYDVPGGEWQDGSEGYYVKVYKDKVLVLGRDFENGKWVSSAQFVVNDRNTDTDKIPDFSQLSTDALSSLVSEAEKIDLSVYTDESASKLSAALAAAKEALANATEQSEIDTAAEALTAAKEGLVEKSSSPTPKPTEQATQSTENSTVAPDAQATDDPKTTGASGGKENGGCGSSISALGIFVVCTAGAAVMVSKKRR